VRRFRERFIERYEARFVPMLEALDEELGIGFTGYGEEASDDAPLLQGLTFPSTTPPPRALPCDKLLLDRVGRALRAQSDEIVITDDDVERMSLSSPLPLPDTFAAIASVGKRDVVLHTVLGPSGVRSAASARAIASSKRSCANISATKKRCDPMLFSPRR